MREGPDLGDHGWEAEEQVLMKLSVATARGSWGAGPGGSGSGLLPSHSIFSSAEGPMAGGPGPGSAVSIRRGSSGDDGKERQRRAGVPGWTRVSGVVTKGSCVEGSGNDGTRGRGVTGLLGVSRSLILPPLRSSRSEKGLTRVRLSAQFGGDSGDGGRKRSDRLRESRGSGLGSVAEEAPLGTNPVGREVHGHCSQRLIIAPKGLIILQEAGGTRVQKREFHKVLCKGGKSPPATFYPVFPSSTLSSRL